MGDWKVPYSDDEDLGEGFYEPSDPNVIINLYEAIQKGEIPQFQAAIYPRKEPESEIKVENPSESIEAKERKTPKKETQEATEFDFDTQPEDNVKRFTPRRTPNRPETKKVAKMSKVFSDIMKYKKMDEKQNTGEKEKKPQAN